MQTQLISAAKDSAKTAADSVQWTLNGIDAIITGNGIMISIVGMVVVFLSLLILVYLIKAVTRSVLYSERKAEKSEARVQVEAPQAHAKKAQISGETIAAIALAMNEILYEIHDEEKTVITIQRISRPYSPWSSKLHSMTRPPYYTSKRG